MKIGTNYTKPYHWMREGLSREVTLCRFTFVKNCLDSSQRVLDIGCGDGFLTKLLSNHVSEVVGVDVSISGLRFAKLKCKNNKIHIVLASATALPFKKGFFNAVTMFEVIEHLNNQEIGVVLSEIRRILKGNAKFILTTPNPRNLKNFLLRKRKVSDKHPKEYTQKELLTVLKDFETIQISGIYLPLPILWLFSKPRYRVLWKPLLVLGKVLPSLAMYTCWYGKAV